MEKLTIGLAPTRRFVFSVEDAHKYKKMIEAKLREWQVNFINIDSINEEGLLINRRDARKAARHFIDKGVDAVFAPHVNFGTEEVVAQMAREVNKPFLLWGPRDEAPLENGHRLRDTQCGLFATSNVLQRYGVPFSYIVSSRVNSEVFERGIKTFLGAARAVKAFMGARIGQVSTRPWNFYTVIIDEDDLLSKWGIETVPITMVRIQQTVLDLIKNDRRVPEEVERIKSRLRIDNIADEMLQRIAALKLTLLDWAEEEELSAIAFRCHEDLQDALGIYPCFVNGELTSLGIPVACETDIYGILSSVLLQNAGAGETPTFFADLTVRHHENDNGELLWHCGNFPLSLARDQARAFLGKHFIIPPGLPGTGNFEIKPGDITIARFGGMDGRYSLLIGHGRGIEGPFTLGTYLWVEVPDWPLWEERLIYGPYVHHVAARHGHSAYSLYEATRFIPGLEPDPVQPTEEEIRAYLRGR